ncbi:MAG: hypothetical protein V1709_05990 [Planctomycetota bacterium]
MHEDITSRFQVAIESGKLDAIFSGHIPAPDEEDQFREYLSDWSLYDYIDVFVTIWYIFKRPKDFTYLAIFRSHHFDRVKTAQELHQSISDFNQRIEKLGQTTRRYLKTPALKIDDVINVFIELWYRMGMPEDLVWLAVFKSKQHNIKETCAEMITFTRNALYKKLKRLGKYIALTFSIPPNTSFRQE